MSQPLTAIANYAGAAIHMSGNEQLDADRLREILQHIVRLAERAGGTLARLRTLMKRDDSARGNVDLNEIAATCLELLSARAAREGVSVQTDLAAGLPRMPGDPIALEQAVMHLLVNALDALAEVDLDKPTLGVQTGVDEFGNVEVRVRDNGHGVQPELAERIFEPWISNKPGAMGIGLATAKTIVEEHGGTIRMTSAPGQGSEFVLSLPGRAGGGG
jgi:C4-dicarboxylate-specific signal transduction histidine kinase